ncbi:MULTISPECIES: hypothetical protein [Actinomadura]|uniref:Uncharacterized protein n=1 Tax=Actinomadura yumaensis TaxID=111807 RepID=A0ABW2CFC3_9ACTN|nr:hypothetical protein [Actinomadura sp. J1-007]MWK34654.1 hypothetical protein [Actinomadura sp. J1-007]
MTIVWTVLIALVAAPVLVVLAAVLLAGVGVGPWRYGSQDVAELRRAADADAAAIRSDDRYFREDGPGRNTDGL